MATRILMGKSTAIRMRYLGHLESYRRALAEALHFQTMEHPVRSWLDVIAQN